MIIDRLMFVFIYLRVMQKGFASPVIISKRSEYGFSVCNDSGGSVVKHLLKNVVKITNPKIT